MKQVDEIQAKNAAIAALRDERDTLKKQAAIRDAFDGITEPIHAGARDLLRADLRRRIEWDRDSPVVKLNDLEWPSPGEYVRQQLKENS